MANKSIPELTDGSPAQSGDLLPISRSGANYKVTAASLASAGALKTVQRTITSNEILNLATTPIEIVAGVVGQAAILVNASLTYVPGTTPYTDPGDDLTSTITSVDAPVTVTDTLTSVLPMSTLQPAWTGLAKYFGTFSSQVPGRVRIAGFANAANNGDFTLVQAGAFPSGFGDYVLVLNPNAVTETHAGTMTKATVVYHGDNSSGNVASGLAFPYILQGMSHAENNGELYCTAADATTMTFSNLNAIAETHAGTVFYPSGDSATQTFVLYTPSSLLTEPYIFPFSATLGVDPFGFSGSTFFSVMAVAGSLDPKICFIGFPAQPKLNGGGNDGQGLFFSIAGGIQSGTPDVPDVDNFLPTAAQNLTGGDGTFRLTVSYLAVQTA